MIYTITLNPSVDLIVDIDDLKIGKLNRMENDLKLPGGKGINISRVLRQLGMPSVASGFLGGFTGDFIDEWLEREDIHRGFTKIADDTRINIKLINQDETYINGKGPNVSVREIQDLLYYLSRVGEGDTVIMTGSIPPTVDTEIYDRIIGICKANKAQFYLDAPYKILKKFIDKKPLLLKPSISQIERIYDVKINSIEEVIPYGERLVKDGVKFVLLPLDEEGSLLFSKDGIYKSAKLEEKLINKVGSKDSMVAGFISSFIKTSDICQSYKVAVAAGLATGLTKDLAKRYEIEDMMGKVEITKIK
ncbi:MAG: 1-phosphofructokinase family hexose kinase [Tissierellia bacterium]|nr:1-phosphofructokinase family hexose kinase [Tissierellia bacterium]